MGAWGVRDGREGEALRQRRAENTRRHRARTVISFMSIVLQFKKMGWGRSERRGGQVAGEGRSKVAALAAAHRWKGGGRGEEEDRAAERGVAHLRYIKMKITKHCIVV